MFSVYVNDAPAPQYPSIVRAIGFNNTFIIQAHCILYATVLLCCGVFVMLVCFGRLRVCRHSALSQISKFIKVRSYWMPITQSYYHTDASVLYSLFKWKVAQCRSAMDSVRVCGEFFLCQCGFPLCSLVSFQVLKTCCLVD